ncbi:nicotinamidase-related amidase [Exiguobacterium sp. PvP048]|uniref:isochorismatase family protein n=1 Tax=unclassified Exiguobacterium TaxID=2644629 RepID=UPI0033913107
MQQKALVVIDIQNDTTKNYKEVIGTINQSIDWAVEQNMHVVYIRHEVKMQSFSKCPSFSSLKY